MASFLKNLINKATNSMSEGINKRVEDGTFNRLASNFGKGISNLGAGMVSIVSMAENAFGKVKDKVSKAKADREQERAERRAEKEERECKAEQLRAERLAMMEKEVVSSGQADDEDDYVAPIALSDDFMERLARIFDIEDEYDLHMLCLTRLTAQTALFFANCDGDYTEKERENIERFKDMVYEYLDGMHEGSSDAIEFLFDGIDRPCTIDEIMAMTHRFTDNLEDKDRKGTIESIDWLVSQIIEADERDDMRTEEFYKMWCKEFKL